ncbi:heterokaryon incompatibility protein-domain-containing protein [Scleroderma yunnanense]
MDRQAKVLEFRDDEATDYAILSHRWIDQEVNYDEITKLAKMEKDEQHEIRHRVGYRKILASCEQAKRDGYKWLWVDTCCIDKRSSAELSEAINSMYRWYHNSRVCYAYLHDVPGISFSTKSDKEKYPNSDGWPEWFSRGWTLQEMIAPENVQFFNQNWQSIGDKKTLARTLSQITRVPEDILRDGLSSNRPCVARIMSWGANRMTTRVEDRAYSLLGLLDVNMPMLYGEGKRAFQRLQLEIIRMSDDQSIFAWGAGRDGDGGQTGSILADDPSFFRDCGEMELMDRDEFIEYEVKKVTQKEEHRSIEDRFGVFPVTNRGIQIWMLLFSLENSDSVFEAWLPCWDGVGDPVRISLVLWNSNYYRYPMCSDYPTQSTAQFRQVYLRYQDPPHSKVTFKIDDSAITSDGFTCCTTHRDNDEDEGRDDGNTLTLTSTDPLRIKVYSDRQNDCCFAVGFGQCFDQDWMHVIYAEPGQLTRDPYIVFHDMLPSGPDYAKSMAEARHSEEDHYDRHVWVRHFCFPGSTWTIRASCVVWNSSRNRGAKIEVFRHPYSGPEKWIGVRVDGADDPNRDMRNLMVRQNSLDAYWLRVDGVSFRFSRAPDGTKLGDYGYRTDCKDFRCEGNIFDDLRSLPSKPVITPKRDRLEDRLKDDTNPYAFVTACESMCGSEHYLYDPIIWTLPHNNDLNSLLASTGIVNGCLVKSVIEYPTVPPVRFPGPATLYRSSDGSNAFHPSTTWCNFVKPFVWYRHEAVDSGSEELRAEVMDVNEERGREG